MKSVFRALGVLAAFLLLWGGRPFASESRPASEPEPVPAAGIAIEGLSVGFDGCYKCGFLTPARLRISGGQGETVRAVLKSEDPDSAAACWEQEIPIPDTGPFSADLLFMPGRENAPLTVSLFAAGGELLDRRVFHPGGVPPALRAGEGAVQETPPLPKPVDSRRPIWLVVGGDISAVTQMLAALQLPAERVPVPVPIAKIADLPHEPESLDAVDLVILNTSDTAAFEGGEDAAGLLLEWTAQGGKTVLFGAAGPSAVLAPGGPLAALAPGTIRAEKPAELRAAPSLVRFVPHAKNLVMLGSLDSPYLKFTDLETLAPDAQSVLNEGEFPLLVRRPIGFGTLIFFAPDPQEAPLSNWNGRSGLLMKIFSSEVSRLTSQAEQTGLLRLGYSDLAGELRSALDRFRGIRPLPFSAVFALLALFAAVIGPFDWFLVHRLLRRPNATWITLPCWLLIFAASAVWLGRAFRPDEFCLNRAEITDIDAATGRARGEVWGGIYVPSDARFRITAESALADAADAESRLAWLGLTGSGLGGISSPIRFFGSPDEEYTLNGGTIRNFPVPIRSTRSIHGRWRARLKPFGARLAEHDGELTGRIVNPLPVPISGAVLFYRGKARFLGTIPPGETVLESQTPKTDEVQRLLLGSVNPFDGRFGDFPDQPVWERYSDTAADLLPILRVAAFYRLAGGRSAAGLGNETVLRLDGTDALDAGRAILWGETERENTALTVSLSDGGKGAWTAEDRGRAVRIWIPVEREEADNAEGR
ncbi:MAG: hypothetical protein IJG60_07525 [Thermoguttaceae bacterium]|nr:hypothetical protein [Thermoguttaceae bacterium]